MLFSFTKTDKPVLLFVDDSIYFTKLLTRILETTYQVYTAANGLEALAMLHQTVKPDLILTDVAMPKMDGYTFIRAMQKNGLFKHIPVCILSDYSISTIQRELCDVPVEAIFTKPFDPQMLMMGLGEVLKQQEYHMV